MSSSSFRQKWLSVVGIGEDALEGLSPAGRLLLAQADIIIGGERHLKMLPAGDLRETLIWSSPIATSVREILNRRGQPVCVLASGDPMCYGIGVTLLRYVPITEMTIVPSPSAFSLACARLGWSLAEVETLSLCGRDPAFLNAVLYPGAKLLVLSADRQTPGIVAKLLTQKGLGGSEVTVLEQMGGVSERTTKGTALYWNNPEVSDLNTIAITCIAEQGEASLSRALQSQLPTFYSRLAGLPDVAYHHDGQLTKQEVRAVTLAALSPLPGQLLWDVGAGCGSVGIEWMRSDRRCRAIAIESNSSRLQFIADNATALGTPNLSIIAGEAPAALKDLPQPDAIFIGGGLTVPDLFETCWDSLRPGGRLVANAITVESEQTIFNWYRKLGGELTRIVIQRAEPIGTFMGWKAMAPVTQWVVTK